MTYTNTTRVSGSFDGVVEATMDALEDEGFGVLCDIDVQATFAEKLDEEFRRYRILGACNPPLAEEALSIDMDVGALLPCNVVVYEADEASGDGEAGGDGETGGIVVSAVDPTELLDVTGESDLEPLGEEVDERLQRVLDSL